MDLVICNCPQCVKEITSSTGEIISGCWDHPTTRRRHWSQEFSPLKDLSKLKLALPSTPPPLANQETTDSEPESKEVLNETESIRYIYYFIVWLSLVCGISQSHCQIARDWIISIIKIFQSLPQDQNSYSKSFRDVQTITKRLRLDPELESAICCLKCFSLYKPEDAPVTCIYRKSKKAQACGESLFKSKHDPLIPQYQPRPTAFVPFIPHLVYHTQKFDSWLKWFLNVPGIEDGVRLKSVCENLLLNGERDDGVASSAFLYYQKTRPPRLQVRG